MREGKTPGQVLREARQLLVEKGWTRGQYAIDARGTPVSARNPDAAAFCMLGAVQHVYGSFGASAVIRLLERAAGPGVELISFNDRRRSVKPVLDLFDRAISLADLAEKDSSHV